MKKTSNHNLVAVAVVAALGSFLGTSAVTGFVANDDVALRYEGEHPNARSVTGTVNRDNDTLIRIQDRRNVRLRAEQEAGYSAAPEEFVEDSAQKRDIRNHYRAYRWCVFNGYDHPRRLPACVDAILSDGDYDVLD